MATPWLVVGLGNPGPRYDWTRHNIGFEVVDAFGVDAAESEKSGVPLQWTENFSSAVARVSVAEQDVVLLKPLTYMNESGRAVREAARFYKTPLERCVVIHDEIDLPLGSIRVKFGGGIAGHNGLRSICDEVGSERFFRVRVGVGRPEDARFDIARWVLAKFDSAELRVVEAVLEGALLGVASLLRYGLAAAQSEVHGRTFGEV